MSVEWMDANWSWVWLLRTRRVGGVLLLSLADAIQRRANSIAGQRDDSNSSLVRREFGRRCGTCQVHSTTVHTADTHTYTPTPLPPRITQSPFQHDAVCRMELVLSTYGSYVTVSDVNFTAKFLHLSWSYSSIPQSDKHYFKIMIVIVITLWICSKYYDSCKKNLYGRRLGNFSRRRNPGNDSNRLLIMLKMFCETDELLSWHTTKSFRWRRGVAVERRIRDREVAGSVFGWALRRKNSGQVSHTYG